MNKIEQIESLIVRLRNTPNWNRESFGDWKSMTYIGDNAPKEAADELEAYAADLRAREAGVTDEVVVRACITYVRKGNPTVSRIGMRAALIASGLGVVVEAGGDEQEKQA